MELGQLYWCHFFYYTDIMLRVYVSDSSWLTHSELSMRFSGFYDLMQAGWNKTTTRPTVAAWLYMLVSKVENLHWHPNLKLTFACSPSYTLYSTMRARICTRRDTIPLIYDFWTTSVDRRTGSDVHLKDFKWFVIVCDQNLWCFFLQKFAFYATQKSFFLFWSTTFL